MAAANNFFRWESPLPYLYGGLSILCGVITVSLIVLACYECKSKPESPSEEETAKYSMMMKIRRNSQEPNVVVIMAGDDNPMYMAKAKPLP